MMKNLLFIALALLPFVSSGQTLEECQQAAERNYPLIAQHDLIARTTDLTVANIQKGWLPQVTATAQATYQNAVTSWPNEMQAMMGQMGLDMKGLAKDQYRVGLDVQQTVFDGGAISAQKRVAREQGSVQQAQLDVSLYNVRQRVNEMYFALLLLEDQIRLNSDLQEQLAASEKKLTSMVKHGTAAQCDLNNVTAGAYYPVVVNSTQTAAEFSKDITVIEARGYLYQAEVALGLKIGDITTLAQAQALEGVQGICPKGWHVPTKADIRDLVGKGSNIDTNPDAPYYDGSNGSIKMLNEDGFNMEAFGAVTIASNTATKGTFMGFFAAYKERIASGMMIGSTQSGNPTYNTSGDASSGLKNIQFSGFMPMTNKATEAEYTCNATNVSYRIAGALRCVRND